MKTVVRTPDTMSMLYLIVAVAMTTNVASQTSDDSLVKGRNTSSNSNMTSADGDRKSAATSIRPVTPGEATTLSSITTTTTTTTTSTTTTAEPMVSLMYHPMYRQLLQRGYQLLSEFNSVSVPANTMDVGKILSAIMQDVNILQVVKRALAQEDIRHVFPKPERVNQHCYDDVIDFIDALIGQKQNASSKEYITTAWALKMADAIGKPPAGLLRGTLQFIGNYDECFDVHANIPNGTFLGSRQTARNMSSKFRTRYCRAQFVLPSPGVSTNDVSTFKVWSAKSMPSIIHWGTCLPESCDRLDIQTLLTEGTLAAFDLPVFDVVCFDRDRDLGSDGWAVFAVCLLSLMAAVALICTVVESAVYYEVIPLTTAPKESGIMKNGLSKETNSYPTENGTEKNEMKAGIPNQRTPLSIDRRPKDVFRDDVIPPKPSNENGSGSKDKQSALAIRLLEAFSIRYNIRKIIATSTSSHPGMLPCIQGIRVISIWWIILGHTYSLVLSNPLNFMYTSGVDMKKTLSRLSFAIIPGANFAVDTFFVISGLLVMMMTLRELRRGKGQTVGFWVMFYLHRIWRLTPVYMMVLMTGTTLYDFLVDGPLKSGTFAMFDYCDTHWWANLLYINNLYKSPEICMIWSWYLAVDMQLFLVSPFFIMLIHRKYRTGLLVLVASIVLGSLATFLLTLDNPGMFATALPERQGDYFKHVYVTPWPRIAVFGVGMLVGVILEDAPDKPYFSKLKAFFIWVVLSGAALFIVLIVHDQLADLDSLWAKGTMALYESTSRLVWSIYIGWIIYACHSGLGGIATEFLTWTGFQPLAKLSYTVYLVHPMINVFFLYERNSTVDLQDSVMINLFCGNLIISYLVAALYTLLFEAPLLALEKIVMNRK